MKKYSITIQGHRTSIRLEPVFWNGLKQMRHLAAQVGAGQIVLGTDYPFPWQDKSVEHVMATNSLSNAQKAAILGGTAQKLLGIKPF